MSNNEVKPYDPRQKYTVYDNRTDQLVVSCAPAEVCAQMMGIKRDSFYRAINDNLGKRWTIIKEGKCEDLYSIKKVPPPDPEPKTIGEFMKKCRKSKGYSQLDVHRATGISRDCLYQYERNKSFPNIFTLIEIADFLEVSIDELIGRKR